MIFRMIIAVILRTKRRVHDKAGAMSLLYKNIYGIRRQERKGNLGTADWVCQDLVNMISGKT